jgi:hypothetical protein
VRAEHEPDIATPDGQVFGRERDGQQHRWGEEQRPAGRRDLLDRHRNGEQAGERHEPQDEERAIGVRLPTEGGKVVVEQHGDQQRARRSARRGADEPLDGERARDRHGMSADGRADVRRGQRAQRTWLRGDGQNAPRR